MKIYSATELKKSTPEQLMGIAETLGINFGKEGATKKEMRDAIVAFQEANKPAKVEKPKPEILNIRDCQVGDVVRYTSSKKPYIVAQKDLESNRPFVFLFSATQQYNSYKEKFEVARISKGDGTLPKKFDDPTLNELLIAAKKELKNRDEIAAAKLAAAKKRDEKAAAAKAAEKPAETVEAVETSWDLSKEKIEKSTISKK